MPHAKVVQSKIRKIATLQSLQNVCAPCYSWKPSIYWGIPALSLWHMLHLSKQTRTVFVPLFKLRKRKKKKEKTNLSHRLWLHQQEHSPFLYQSSLTQALKSLCVLLPLPLIFLFYAPGPALIISALPAQFWKRQQHPFLSKSSFVNTLNRHVRPVIPEQQTHKTHSLHTRHCNNMWAGCLCPPVSGCIFTPLKE